MKPIETESLQDIHGGTLLDGPASPQYPDFPYQPDPFNPVQESPYSDPAP